MDIYQAFQNFWESFGIDAYDENTVPTGNLRPELPYITYNVVVSYFNRPTMVHASVWYYGTSWKPITEKMKEIEAVFDNGGKFIECDNGAIWMKKGRPFAQRMSDPNDMIRRFYINVEAEFITAY